MRRLGDATHDSCDSDAASFICDAIEIKRQVLIDRVADSTNGHGGDMERLRLGKQCETLHLDRVRFQTHAPLLGGRVDQFIGRPKFRHAPGALQYCQLQQRGITFDLPATL